MCRSAVVVAFVAVLSACGAAGIDGGGTGGGAGGGEGGGGGGGAADATYQGLNCGVAQVLASRCSACHGTTPAGGASFSLTNRAELMVESPQYAGQTYAQRSVTRMQATTSPMPPAPNDRATAEEIGVLQNWVLAGTPEESCGAAIDGGTQQLGPYPTTCASNIVWSLGDLGSSHMNPGLACRACHVTKEPGRAYFFMGTVFPALHEKDRCNAVPPAGLRVEIIDANGQLAQTLTVRSPSGNFYSNTVNTNIALPYTARVVDTMGNSLTMNTPQAVGDCNTCHTEQGLNGAPGRIIWPH